MNVRYTIAVVDDTREDGQGIYGAATIKGIGNDGIRPGTRKQMIWSAL